MAKIETIKYLCDCCGEEIVRGTKSQYAIRGTDIRTDSFGNIIETQKIHEIDLCRKCAEKLDNVVSRYFGSFEFRENGNHIRFVKAKEK